MSKWSIFALCIIAAVGLWFYNNGACPLQAMSPSSDTASSGSYQQITASQVKERLDKGDKITVIDVRTPDEYAAGHIPGSLLIPFDEIKVKSDQLPQNKNTEISGILPQRQTQCNRCRYPDFIRLCKNL